jgi:hypothetical protein
MRSTGLGKTLLQGRLAKLEYTNVVPETLKNPENGVSEPKRLLMTMQIIAPVSWTVRAFIEPADVRQLVGYFLKHPIFLLYAGYFLIFGGKSPSLIVNKGEKGK